MDAEVVTSSRRERMAALAGQVAGSRAAWFFAAAWAASALALVLSGQGFPLVALMIGLAYLLLSALTVALTEPPPASWPAAAGSAAAGSDAGSDARPAAGSAAAGSAAAGPAAAGSDARLAAGSAAAGPADRARLWLQVGLILLFIVLAGWNGLVFHGVVAAEAAIPLWTPLMDWLQRLGGQMFGNDNYIANPVAYFVLPLAALLLTGARLPELGFGRGHRVGRVLLLWCALPLALFAVALLAGQVTPARLGARFVSNFMQNGLWEEFLFRGALQTRLRRLWTPGWALVVQALLFGAWHLGLGFTNTGHEGWLPALASVIVHQAVVGLAFGVIFERTRNLLAPSVVHIVVNMVG